MSAALSTVAPCSPTAGVPAEPCPICAAPGRCTAPQLMTAHCQCTACGFYYTESARRFGFFRIEVYRDNEWWPLGARDAEQLLGRAERVQCRHARQLEPQTRELKSKTPGQLYRVIRPSARRAVLRF